MEKGIIIQNKYFVDKRNIKEMKKEMQNESVIMELSCMKGGSEVKCERNRYSEVNTGVKGVKRKKVSKLMKGNNKIRLTRVEMENYLKSIRSNIKLEELGYLSMKSISE